MATKFEGQNDHCCAESSGIRRFEASNGEVTFVSPGQEIDSEASAILNDPEILSVFLESIADYKDGRFTDFEL